jgi:transposase-like protein
VWVLGAVEKSEPRRIRLTVVDDRSMPTLTHKIKEIVKEDSLIYTDCWRGYNELSSTYKAHETVNHSRHFKDPETGVHTNSIEGNWFGVKMQIPPRLRTKDKINLYLVRYMILRNEPGHPMEAIIKYLF